MAVNIKKVNKLRTIYQPVITVQFSTKNTKNDNLERSIDFDKKGPKFDMKYFITRSTILAVYRESLKLAYSFKDQAMKEQMIEMMKHEFRPFRVARDKG